MLALGNCWWGTRKQVPHRKNDVEFQETKMVNMFCNYTSYQKSHLEDWIDKNINIDFKEGMKILHIGSIYQEFLSMYSDVMKLNIEVIDHSILRIHQLQKKLKSLPKNS